MPQPLTADKDTAPGVDFRVIAPSTELLNPVPRGLHFVTSGAVVMDCPDSLPPFNVAAGQTLPARPTRILPGTTATVLALY
ncbi:MAG: hypothetical protein ABJL72_12130 [Roseobacter sp.]